MEDETSTCATVREETAPPSLSPRLLHLRSLLRCLTFRDSDAAFFIVSLCNDDARPPPTTPTGSASDGEDRRLLTGTCSCCVWSGAPLVSALPACLVVCCGWRVSTLGVQPSVQYVQSVLCQPFVLFLSSLCSSPRFSLFVSAQRSGKCLILSHLALAVKAAFRMDQRQRWSHCGVRLRRPGPRHSRVTAHVCRLMLAEKPREARRWEDLDANSYVAAAI